MLCNLFRPTFHVPFSCQPLLSISACSFGRASRLAVLVAEVYLGILLLLLQVLIFELEMRERTFRTLLSRLKTAGAMFELELRERASHTTSARGHLRLRSQSWSCCGNALRARLWPEPWERTSRTTFALKSCDFAAGAL